MNNRQLWNASSSTEFDKFLQATIDEEPNGTPLTVLSALIRLDRDPWKEAARLSRLPQDSAMRDLATMIGFLPGRERSLPEDEKIALRLLEKLYGGKKHGVPDAPQASQPATGRLSPEALAILAFMWLLFVATLAAFSFANAPLTGHAAKPGVQLMSAISATANNRARDWTGGNSD